MRIIKGRFRHRKLLTNPGLHTRPLTARAKNALFDRLAWWMDGARVLDVFSGTGTIGFEALSRGAQSVVFIENDRKAFELLRANVAALKVEDETVCWRTDAARCSFKPLRAEGFYPYDVVFFDPPYDVAAKLTESTLLYRTLGRLARETLTTPDVLLLFRCRRNTVFAMPPAWKVWTTFSYASMDIHLYHKEGYEHAADHPPQLEPLSAEELREDDDVAEGEATEGDHDETGGES